MAIDWSGDRRSARRIWAAIVRPDETVELVGGRSRHQITEDLCHAGDGDELVVGFDFSFALPFWYMRAQGYLTAPDLWRAAESEGEAWLAACEPPWWGRPGTTMPRQATLFRRCERSLGLGSARPKSTFQVGGAGAVGTGSVRGWPHLLALRAAGFAVWPFDRPATRTVVEIYPRLFTGPVVKRDGARRRAHVAGLSAPDGRPLPASVAEQAGASEDAFDALFSALALWRYRSQVRSLVPAADPVTRLEGAIWIPPPASQ